MPNRDNFHSDEAQAIMGRAPSWVVRWGVTVVFVIVAHRLSTVKNADQIIVLDHGKIVELGTHAELTAKKGYYYELVKNQLELGTG